MKREEEQVRVEELLILIVVLDAGSVESDNRPNVEEKNVLQLTKKKSNSVIRHHVHLHQSIANLITGVLGAHVLHPAVLMDPDPEDEGSNRRLKMVGDHVLRMILKQKLVVVAKIVQLKMIFHNQNVSFNFE